jgi:hypothetical protein
MPTRLAFPEQVAEGFQIVSLTATIRMGDCHLNFSPNPDGPFFKFKTLELWCYYHYLYLLSH